MEGHPMKRYTVKNDAGTTEILEVAAETDLGYHVKISVADQPRNREYRDFISRILFETLVRSGTLEPMSSEAWAG